MPYFYLRSLSAASLALLISYLYSFSFTTARMKTRHAIDPKMIAAKAEILRFPDIATPIIVPVETKGGILYK